MIAPATYVTFLCLSFLIHKTGILNHTYIIGSVTEFDKFKKCKVLRIMYWYSNCYERAIVSGDGIVMLLLRSLRTIPKCISDVCEKFASLMTKPPSC